MATTDITGARFLIVEDEYLLADEARQLLSAAGAEVMGPVATAEEAHRFVESGRSVDVVLLDINLRGDIAFGVADLLQARGIPFAFITGYDCASLPERFAGVPRLQKPASSDAMVQVAARLAAVTDHAAAG